MSRVIDALTERIGRVTAWAIVAAVLVSATNAIIRKLFGISSNAWLELQWYLFGAVFMLCAAWTLRANEHIRIDVLSARLSYRTRNIIEMIGHLFFLLPFVAVMIYLSTPFFLRSAQSGEVSTNVGGLLIWPAKGLILLGFVLLGLQWFSEIVKRIGVMRGEVRDDHLSASHHAAAEAEAERLLAALESDTKANLPSDAAAR